MSKTLSNVKIIQKHNTSATWSTLNPTLLKGQIGYESDTGRAKFGDGATPWNSLPYFGGNMEIQSTAPTSSNIYDVGTFWLNTTTAKLYVAMTKTLSATTWHCLNADVPSIEFDETANASTPSGDTVKVPYAFLIDSNDNHKVILAFYNIPTKAYVDAKVAGAVDYLGTVASIAQVTAKNNAGYGDFVRVTTQFTANGDTAHVGDILFLDSEEQGAYATISNWRIAHTEIDKNTWTANSKTAAGYVKAGSGYANKVWKTDSEGNPDWRDDENTTYESKAASSGGTDKSLVTTGEKHIWNNKQNAITSSNKLSADLLQDGSTNKTVTEEEKNKWNDKQDSLDAEQLIKVSTYLDLSELRITSLDTGIYYISGSDYSIVYYSGTSNQDGLDLSDNSAYILLIQKKTPGTGESGSVIWNWLLMTTNGEFSPEIYGGSTTEISGTKFSKDFSKLIEGTTTSAVTQNSTALITSGAIYANCLLNSDTLILDGGTDESSN